jgi:hypothetical protein
LIINTVNYNAFGPSFEQRSLFTADRDADKLDIWRVFQNIMDPDYEKGSARPGIARPPDYSETVPPASQKKLATLTDLKPE